MGADAKGRGKRPAGSGRGEAGATDVVGLVDELLDKTVASRASDVHFEPTAAALVVKFRLDGALNTIEELPKALAENVVARLKVLGGLLTYRNDVPQEGHIAVRAAAGAVRNQRLAVFPTVHGERAVVRLFHEESELTQLDRLGLPAAILAGLKRIAGGNEGVLLLTGPAGSGKSTTLAAVLRHILTRHPNKSIVTLEDPVERYIDGVTQVQIPPHGAMTFPVALRSLLRQDPEVLMIGEIRDAETARIAIEAGLTGHLLMSTMHSGTPAGALLRLLEMGVEPYQVTSSVCAVLNQRLVRRLCEQCIDGQGSRGRRSADGGRHGSGPRPARPAREGAVCRLCGTTDRKFDSAWAHARGRGVYSVRFLSSLCSSSRAVSRISGSDEFRAARITGPAGWSVMLISGGRVFCVVVSANGQDTVSAGRGMPRGSTMNTASM